MKLDSNVENEFENVLETGCWKLVNCELTRLMQESRIRIMMTYPCMQKQNNRDSATSVGQLLHCWMRSFGNVSNVSNIYINCNIF